MKQGKKVIFGISLICVCTLIAVSGYWYQYGAFKIIRNCILTIGLFYIAVVDQREKRIPNRSIALLLILRAVLLIGEIICYPVYGKSLCLSCGIGFLLGGGVLLLAYAVSRGGIGMGDIKLFAVIGAYVGSGSVAASMLLSMIAAAVFSGVMIARKKLKIKDEIALGPFVAIGTILTLLIGA